ncbi:uncharacterized protein LOC133736643 isoform X1 [Rosa rugosa]|uniref:uncharacterized protein LOC133736643 isoform X1 n=1 Tax=Rosa rugosa TaxID=74645 RepID=UPI002B406559|nr:uncharacterized protein LOC133736643 isoform X1 [Rosa rugosa]
MDAMRKKEKEHGGCTTQFCFFCAMKEPDSFKRRATLATCFKQMPLRDDQENVLVLSSLWHIAMTHPDDQEFPNLGIFECMARLIHKGIKDQSSRWLQKHQNIYIPYYAAHVIGSYTMNRVEFAKIAAESGVIPPLLELLRGKMSWVEQRVAVRALGHLASYEKTFKLVADYEEEMVRLAMELASTCVNVVYASFVGVKDKSKRLKYHCDLVTRGIGGLEMENSKAEEWASQLQCWSLYILNCFACKQRPLALKLICKQEFLRELCGMWGGLLANQASPAGIGLIRILCYSKYGRRKVAESKEVIERLCNLSRSSDDWQYMGIDCLLLLLKDADTRYNVIDISALFLIDLVELRSLGDHRSNLGETIAKTLLLDYKQRKSNKNEAVEELRSLIERSKKERVLLSGEIWEERRVLVDLIKQEANHLFCEGEVEEALIKYSEALALCPIRLRKERMVLYSNRAQCQLLLRDPDSAIRDTTRALCLSSPANSHGKSLWRRSQAYDMKGLTRESLMDCVMFINGCIKSEKSSQRVKIPYYAARMISKQMDATWIFATARSTMATSQVKKVQESEGNKGNNEGGNHNQQENHDEMMKILMENKGKCLSTILEEPLMHNMVKEGSSRRKQERTRRM